MKEKYRRGRHIGTERADKNLTIRLSESDLNILTNLASEAQMSRSAFVVECVMRPVSTARKLRRNENLSNILTSRKELVNLLEILKDMASELESRPRTENCDDIILRVHALLAYINYGGEII